MHRQIRQLLDTAESESESLVAVNVDIRGFSAFSASVESVDVAFYLRRAYIEMLDRYFPEAKFFKLTGDGLLLIFGFTTADDLKHLVAHLLKRSRRLLGEFGKISAKDPLVYFPVPANVGIGISRGAASRISSDDTIIDYAGRTLNTASRLMAVARPYGVVLDETIAAVMSPAMKRSFTEDEVYLPGVAESSPLKIWRSSQVVIGPGNRVPIASRWHTQVRRKSLRDWKRPTVRRWYEALEHTPDDPKKIQVVTTFPARGLPGQEMSISEVNWSYGQREGRPQVTIDMDEVVSDAKERKTRLADPVSVRISYLTAEPPRPPTVKASPSK